MRINSKLKAQNSKLALLSLAVLAFSLRATESPGGILVPAYFYPAGNNYWSSLAQAAKKVPIIAILNPNSGPGAGIDSNYVVAAKKLRDKGGRVIGYVS